MTQNDTGQHGTRNAERGALGTEDCGLRTCHRRRRGIGLIEVLLAAIIAVWIWLIPAGCAQNTEPEFRQQQTPAAPTEQAQAQDTYGGHTIRIDNRQTDGLPMGGELPVDFAADRVALIKATTNEAAADGLVVRSPTADLIQFQVYNLTTSANTTPTGTQSSAPQVASTATGTQTTTPTQTVSPETGIALPVAVAMPGGVADSTAAASGSGAATQDKQGSHTATAQMLETLANEPELRRQFLEILTRPTPAPDATTNGE